MQILLRSLSSGRGFSVIIFTQKNGLGAMGVIQLISLTNEVFLEIYPLKTSDLKPFLTKSWQKTEDEDWNYQKHNQKRY